MNDLCDKAILVSAHPDDEVLWSSSILNRVDEVVICFLGMKSEPDIKRGREKSLGAYPLGNVSCLGLDEAGTFYGVDWNNPVLTPYGIKIADRKYPDKTYRENYHRLKDLLQDKLVGYANVFTHNPWGEYGNDEHIQVYRAIRDLQESMQFRVWFPNYVSNKSFRLMLEYMNKSVLESVPMKTDIGLAETVKKLYTGNRCWTWYADWQWQADEAFLSEKVAAPRTGAFRSAVPLNMIKVWLPPVSKTISLFQSVPLCRTGGRRMLNRITKTIASNLKNI